jgi:hypothetical protein
MMVKMLNDIFTIFDKITSKYGLEKIKPLVIAIWRRQASPYHGKTIQKHLYDGIGGHGDDERV